MPVLARAVPARGRLATYRFFDMLEHLYLEHDGSGNGACARFDPAAADIV